MIGAKLKQMRQDFCFLTVKLGNSQGCQKATAHARKVYHFLSLMKSELEERMFSDNTFPSGVEALDVYYGVQPEVEVWIDRVEMEKVLEGFDKFLSDET